GPAAGVRGCARQRGPAASSGRSVPGGRPQPRDVDGQPPRERGLRLPARAAPQGPTAPAPGPHHHGDRARLRRRRGHGAHVRDDRRLRGRGPRRGARRGRRPPPRHGRCRRGRDELTGTRMRTASSRRQILLSRETLLGLVAVLVLAAVCVMLGLWQFGRYEDRAAQAEVVRSNYDAAPVPLDEVMPEIGAPLAPSDEWTPVTLHGSCCSDAVCVLYVRNRPLSGRVCFWQLAPFRTEDGTTSLVVRGWVPSGGEASQPADPPPVPRGDRTVTVRLRPAEPVLDREPPAGQTHSVNPGQSAGLMGLEDPDLVTGAYGELVSEEPSAERPAALPSPDTSLGPHLSYALHWW